MTIIIDNIKISMRHERKFCINFGAIRRKICKIVDLDNKGCYSGIV